MTKPLENTVALVTGSSSGIGAATARRLAAEGAAVALVARRRDRLDDLAAAIRADGGTALAVPADVTSRQQAADAVGQAVARLGRLDTVVTITSTAGRVARPGSSVYSLTKFGAAAFSEALRQELLGRRVRVSVVEPGTVDTELVTHLRDDIRQAAQSQTASIEPLRPGDIADAVAYIVTRDRRVAVNEILVRAAEQTW